MPDILTNSKTISTWGKRQLSWGKRPLPSPSSDCINFLKPAYSKKQPGFLWKQPGNGLYRVFSKCIAHGIAEGWGLMGWGRGWGWGSLDPLTKKDMARTWDEAQTMEDKREGKAKPVRVGHRGHHSDLRTGLKLNVKSRHQEALWRTITGTYSMNGSGSTVAQYKYYVMGAVHLWQIAN